MLKSGFFQILTILGGAFPFHSSLRQGFRPPATKD
jgi:hypothetical protein